MVKSDKRKKLTQAQKEEIAELINSSKLGDRKIAEQFGVSRRTIQFLRDPAKLEANRDLAKRRKELKEKSLTK
jgi:hypothetical protein